MKHAIAAAMMVASLTMSAEAQAPRYTSVRDGEIVRLTDRVRAITVSIMPSAGNIAYEMKVKGHDVLRFPHANLEAFKARPSIGGIPFMGPWANRLDEQAFYANGRRYAFDMTLGNVRGPIPIHGFLTTVDQWRVTAFEAGDAGALVTSRLEVSREPAWMRQWPFPHAIEMTYRLADGALEVQTAITNLGAEPMPVAIGFHPYLQLTDSSRDEWTIEVGARTRWKLDANKLPTGDTEPIAELLSDPLTPLREYNLDDVFGDLVRDPQGRARMTVRGRSQRVDVVMGPRYRAAVVWAPNPAGIGRGGQGASPPAERNFICFEPMAAITNGLNLAHRGRYGELQSIAPGGRWQESFWIAPSGF